ncbi:MAG: FMN-binding protein [Rubrivivax sp.]
MNAPANVPAAPAVTSTPRLVRSLGLVAAICGLIVVGAYEGTLDAARANRKLAAERAVFKVLPQARHVAEYLAMPSGELVPGTGGDVPAGAVRFYAAYDDADRLAGIAAEGAAKGYADTVRVMFGYSKACQCVVGMSVVSMRETPGIGDKIITDKAFLRNFEHLDVALTQDLSTLANEVKVVKHGTKTQAWQIDAISGSTVTSRAVGKGINDAAKLLLPRLVPKIDQLEKKP